MWPHPVVGSIASWMKSSRCRLEPAEPTHAMPRLQMSPTCIGASAGVSSLVVHVAWSGGDVKFADCPANKPHLHAPAVTLPDAAQPPGSALPVGPVSRRDGG